MRYELEKISGHLIINLLEGAFVLDTGSPSSFSRVKVVSFGGVFYPVGDSAMGMMDADDLSKNIGYDVVGLVGMDILAEHNVLFRDTELLTNESIPTDFDGKRIDTEVIMGIPSVTITVGGRTVKSFIDSGAKVSYLSSALIEDYPIVEKVQDFYPGIGSFETEISVLDVYIEDEKLKLQTGRLPNMLGMMLVMLGVDGILGRDLFENYAILIEKETSQVSIKQL